MDLKGLKNKGRLLKTQTYTLYLACRHPATPWYAKLFMGCVVAYAICPIDLIPDFIPVLGYLDDLIIVPGGIYLALKMIPRPVYTECLARAETGAINTRTKWIALSVVILIWAVVLFFAVKFLWGLFR